MAEKRPLALYAGRIEELRTADSLPGALAALPGVTSGQASTLLYGAVSNLQLDASDVNRPHFWPHLHLGGYTVASLSVSVSVLGGTKARVGIHALTSSGIPGALLAQSQDIDTSTTGYKTAILVTPIRLPPGLYAMQWLCNSASARFRALSHASGLVVGADGSLNHWIGTAYSTGWSTLVDASGIVGVTGSSIPIVWLNS